MGAVISADLLAGDHRFAIVVARWNDFIVAKLIEGAKDSIVRHGGNAENITTVYVPGSFEIPLIAKKVADSGSYDALICLGCVIRGQTAHFDFVAGEAAKGIAQVSLSSGVPIGFGIVTADTLEQAVDRAGGKHGNKGSEAALAAIEMVNVLKALP